VQQSLNPPTSAPPAYFGPGLPTPPAAADVPAVTSLGLLLGAPLQTDQHPQPPTDTTGESASSPGR
jgi:hypothetical protein